MESQIQTLKDAYAKGENRTLREVQVTLKSTAFSILMREFKISLNVTVIHFSLGSKSILGVISGHF